MDSARNTEIIRKKALDLGFSHCTFAMAGFLHEEEQGYLQWLSSGYHAGMDWLERNLDKRLDPRKLEPWSKSVICLALNYYPSDAKNSEAGVKISKYAWGRDYHKVVRKKLNSLIGFMHSEFGGIAARGFVDSAPVAERAWARRSGMGWIGKNSLLLIKRGGSFYFLSVILTDLELIYDAPLTLNYCGSCTLCIDACPTGALVKPGVLDSRRCISYLTIELKGETDSAFGGSREGWVFGCDICQDVCPHNKRFSMARSEAAFVPNEDWFRLGRSEWLDMDRQMFERLFRGSPVMRCGYEGMKRNLRLALGADDDGRGQPER